MATHLQSQIPSLGRGLLLSLSLAVSLTVAIYRCQSRLVPDCCALIAAAIAIIVTFYPSFVLLLLPGSINLSVCSSKGVNNQSKVLRSAVQACALGALHAHGKPVKTRMYHAQVRPSLKESMPSPTKRTSACWHDHVNVFAKSSTCVPANVVTWLCGNCLQRCKQSCKATYAQLRCESATCWSTQHITFRHRHCTGRV